MINIGCDIGKSDFDVYFLGKHRKFSNNSEGINKFLAMCSKNTDIRVVLEPTGGYEKQLVRKLFERKTQVSVVNLYYVRNFAKSFRDLAKTDKIDSKVFLSEYWEKMNPKIQEEVEKSRFELEELTKRRDVLLEALKEEKTRLEKMPSQRIETSIANYLKFLEESIKDLEKQINGIVEKNAQDEAEILQSEKGIGEQTTAILLASLPELGKLDNREISKLVSLAPMAHGSGKCNLEDTLEAAELASETRCLWHQLVLSEVIKK